MNVNSLLVVSLVNIQALTASVFNYSESVEGDLSDNYLSPTVLVVSAGSNVITGSLSGNSNDLDLFRLVVPSNLEVVSINLLSFSGGGNGSFLMAQPGDTLSSPPSNDFADPIGYSIISSTNVGDNLLPTISIAIPTVPPFFGATTLTEGNYAFWLNETGQASNYSIGFNVSTAIPEPSAISLASLAGLALAFRRPRR